MSATRACSSAPSEGALGCLSSMVTGLEVSMTCVFLSMNYSWTELFSFKYSQRFHVISAAKREATHEPLSAAISIQACFKAHSRKKKTQTRDGDKEEDCGLALCCELSRYKRFNGEL